MKKITLLTVVLFVTLISRAQITKGSTFIGGHISGSSAQEKADNSDAEIKGSYLGVGLEFGKFFAKNKAAGLFINYSSDKYKQNMPANSYKNTKESHGFATGFFYRQYFPLSSKWYLFGEADLSYGKSKSEENSNDVQTIKGKGWGISASITPGLSFAAGKRLFIETAFKDLFSLYYSHSKSDCYNAAGTFTGSSQRKSLGATANTDGSSYLQNIQFGLRWILPGKN